MSLWAGTCDGCVYSGHPHNENCPEAAHNKYKPTWGVSPTEYHTMDQFLNGIPWMQHNPDTPENRIQFISVANREKFIKVYEDHKDRFLRAQGSSKNHQAWEGGYLQHVIETMNIACWLYYTNPRRETLPFQLSDALEVMFLHDIEKPFKVKIGKETFLDVTLFGKLDPVDYWWRVEERWKMHGAWPEATKENRKRYRAHLIEKHNITLTPEQQNALQYVEGIPDSEYQPGERIMLPLAAFCHCCDILSARLWHDQGQKGAW